MNRADVLDEAKRCVTKDRAATHGAPEQTFGMIAAIWSARLGIQVTPEQTCIMMMDLKTCRAWNNPSHADNWVDMAGYAACGGELALPDNVQEEMHFPPADKANGIHIGSAGSMLQKIMYPTIKASDSLT